MKGMSIVFERSLRDILRTKTFLVIASVFAAITIGGAIGASIGLNGWLKSELDWEAAKPMLEFIMGLTVYFMSIIVMFTYILVFAGDPITKEKSKGTFESLLAAPLSVKAVWMGKSLAIFLPALIIGIAATVILILVANFVSIIPNTGHFILPAPVAVTGFLFNPLIILFVTLLSILISLIYNPQIGTIVTTLVFVGLLQGIGQTSGRGIIDIASWEFALYNLAGVALLGIIVFYLSRFLSKETVILSSKGG